MRARTVDVVIVVVPVHDEAVLLGRCLVALAAAVDEARSTGVHVITRIVLDACTDGSAAIVQAHGMTALHIERNLVGAARAAGVVDAWCDVGDIDASRIWIANTDGDSAVPPNWLTAQLDAAGGGADVFIGTVRPDFADLHPRHQRHWHANHTPGLPNGHVHGASLGVRGDSYLRAGGFEPGPEHEDVQLVTKCRCTGAVVVASDAAEVLTSGRAIGRTPGGYAGYLRDQARELALE